jgi:hypothetical protein
LGKFLVRREPSVEGFIARLSELARKRVERNLEKLEGRGFGVTAPLAQIVEGEIYALFSEHEAGQFTCIGYYFDDARDHFRAFWTCITRKESLTRSQRKELRDAYLDLTWRQE